MLIIELLRLYLGRLLLSVAESAVLVSDKSICFLKVSYLSFIYVFFYVDIPSNSCTYMVSGATSNNILSHSIFSKLSGVGLLPSLRFSTITVLSNFYSLLESLTFCFSSSLLDKSLLDSTLIS